jgi:hypothetical protein
MKADRIWTTNTHRAAPSRLVTFLVLLATVFTLAACGPAEPTAGIATPTVPTATIEATAAPTASPTAQATPTLIPTPVPEPLQSYENPALGVALQIPVNAEVYEDAVPSVDGTVAEDPGAVAFRLAAAEERPGYVLAIRPVDLAPGTPLESFVTERTECDEVTVEGGRAAVLGGQDALLFPDTNCGPYGSTLLYTIFEGTGYEVTIVGDAGYDVLARQIDPVLATWRFGSRIRPEPSPTPDLAQLEMDTWSDASPDGKWIAEVSVALPAAEGVSTGENYYTRLVIRSTDGLTEWVVVDEWSHFGLGYTVPGVLRWSDDGLSVTVVDRAIPDGCYLFEYLANLRRVDLADGRVEALAPGLEGALALSPDGALVAALQRELVLRDLANGEEVRVPLDVAAESWQAGSLIWAPDSSAVAYTLAIHPCGIGGEQVHSIVRAESGSGAQTILADQEPRRFVTVEWPAVERLIVVDGDGTRWWMDASTGELLEQAVQPPAGLVYWTADGTWQTGDDGQVVRLYPAADAQLSPNGERLLITRDESMWVIDLATGKEAKVPTAEGYPHWRWPVWGWDNLVLFGSWPEGEEPGPSAGHLTAAAQGLWVQVLDRDTNSNTLPAAAPEEGTIAYDQAGAAALYRLEGGAEPLDMSAFGVPMRENSRAGSPAWSPDGGQLAWVVGSDFGQGWQLAVVVLDLQAGTAQIFHPYEPRGVGGWSAAPVWSPTGGRLAYHLWPAADPTEEGIWVFDLASGEEQQIGPGLRPVWSPDGERLVYSEDLGGGRTVAWLVQVEGWQRQLLSLPTGALVIAWR